MRMKTREKHIDEQPLREMSRREAALYKIWGPAESWDNPLMGTRFDPAVKQHRFEVRRAKRAARRARHRLRRDQRRLRREQRRNAAIYEPSEHYTPDE